MFLSRLRIRGKLTLLVTIPLLAMFVLVLPVVRDQVTSSRKATDIDAAATVAGRIGAVLQDLQRERLLSVGYLLGVVDQNDVLLQTASVTDRVTDVLQDLGDSLPPRVREEIDRTQLMNPLRRRVLAKTVTPEQVVDDFVPLLDGLIESLELVQQADATLASGRHLIALDALLRMDESNTESTALLAIMAGEGVGDLPGRYHEERAEYNTFFERFSEFATQSQRDQYDLVADGFRRRVGIDFDVKFEADPVSAMAKRPIGTLFTTLVSFSALGTFVEKDIVEELTSSVADQRRQQLTFAYGVGGFALLVLLAVLILVAFVARAVAVPLTRLSRSAEQVAEAGETELRRVADDDSETVDPVHLEVLEVNSNDEIGDLARAFERVQTTASKLVERQVLSRRNVAEMFGHIGRRTQNLVGGQVDLIDELENEETSPDRLAKLYRLDHIANRLRRSADSLVVISGAEREENHPSPVRLVDVARLALAEIEEYTRVDLDVPLDLAVAPAAVSDLVLMCGELLENATNFSPPHTRVTVSARVVPGGAHLVVVDHGIGMPDERLAEENTRIARRERLDLVPTQVLGLFVVGRLARRHGLGVALQHTPGGGVTVVVRISGALLVSQPVSASATPPPSAAEPAQSSWGGPQPAATLPAPYRSAPEPAPRSPEQWRPPTEPDPISRITEVMNHSTTWNGFEKARSLPAPPSTPAPTVTFREQPSGSWPHAPATPALESPAYSSAPEPHRRVPGAHPPAVTSAALSDQAFVEAFQAGARRAQNAAAAPPVIPLPPAAEPAPAFRPGDGAAPASVPRGAPGPGIRSLNRRQPGATLSAPDLAPRRAADLPPIDRDPDAARSFVEQFESGVARALQDDEAAQRNGL
ncbi:nitrate- and nitrite sensing domain-containing protein [Actinoplanes sp. NPDC049802]|uniref:sensor histidine kinase n=1 Tax=Actinoplanes sp. NPDC049802 TaxID=3154742 RepID=UPI0033C5DE49